MPNNAGSGVGAGIGAPPAGAQPSTLAMAQQNQLQSGIQFNFMPPAQRPALYTRTRSARLVSPGAFSFMTFYHLPHFCQVVYFVSDFPFFFFFSS